MGMWLTGPRFWPGLGLLVAGELVRLWAVGHIGLPSRTREVDVGPLVDTGPYGRVRNPLYIGNILIWAGFGLWCWPWVWLIVPASAWYYSRIVAWEEQNLRAQLGAPYLSYLERVPRWWPRLRGPPGDWSATKALRTERSTLLTLAVSLLALGLRAGL